MFDRYELTLMKDLLVKEYAKEFKERENQGLSDDTIKAQLSGLFNVLVKVNIELVKTKA